VLRQKFIKSNTNDNTKKVTRKMAQKMATQIKEEQVCSILDLSPLSSMFDLLELSQASLLQDAASWPKYNTRYGSRKVNSIDYEFLVKLHNNLVNEYEQPHYVVIKELMRIASTTVGAAEGFFIPLQLFICYYENGSNVTPMHSHPCRQITLSIGADRTMRIKNKQNKKQELKMYNGSILYLHGQEHSIIKEADVSESRLSFNLFFTTSVEQQGVNAEN
jgi:hypothetical protein